MTESTHLANPAKGSRTRAWFLLFRPWSYAATLVPFLTAAGLCARWADNRWGYWALGLFSGLLFQSTVNLLNTWGDEKSGVDGVPGAICTTPQVRDGLVSLDAVLAVGLVCAFLACTVGCALCFYRASDGWHLNLPLLVAGFVGFLGSTNYSTGVKFKYHGLGVPFVSFLMGPLEIFVAFALLNPAFAREILRMLVFPPFLLGAALLTLPIAALVGVIMHGNDMRDIPTDRAAGIVTLASRLGPRGALRYYRICHLLPYGVTLCLIAFSCLRHGSFTWAVSWFWLPLLVLPISVRTMSVATKVYRSRPENPPWRGLERATGAVLLLYGTLYALSFALS